MGALGVVVVLFLLALLLVLLVLPIIVANNRNIEPKMKNLVIVLTLLGLITGLTWIAAIVIACVSPSVQEIAEKEKRRKIFVNGKDEEGMRIEKMMQLTQLYQAGVLTKEELEEKKRRLLGE